MADCLLELRKNERFADITAEEVQQMIVDLENIKKHSTNYFTDAALSMEKYTRAQEAKATKRANFEIKSPELVAGMKEHLATHKDPVEYRLRMLGGSNLNLKDSFLSFDRFRKIKSAEYANLLQIGMGDHLKDFTNGKLDAEVSEYMSNKYYGKDLSKFSESTKAIGDTLRKFYDFQLKNMQDAGVYVNERKNYAGPQSHDRAKIMNDSPDRGYQEWKNYIVERLDKTKTFTDASVEAIDLFMIKYFKENIVNPRFNDSPGKVTSMSYSRELIFKDLMAHNEYNTKYGSGSMFNTALKSIFKSSSAISEASIFGDITMWENLSQKVIGDELVKTGTNKQIEAMAKGKSNAFESYKNLKKNLFGFDNPGENAVSKTVAGISKFESLIKLQMSLLNTTDDLGLSVAANSAFTGKNWIKSSIDVSTGFIKGLTNSKDRNNIAQRLGLYYRNEIINNFDKHGIDGDPSFFASVGNSFSKLTKHVGELNLLEWQSRNMRENNARQFAYDLADNSHLPFNSLDIQLQRSMNRSGIGENEWNVIRNAKEDVHLWTTDSIISPEKLGELPDSEFTVAAQKAGKSISGYKQDLKLKLTAMIQSVAETGSPESTIRNKAIANQGLASNTLLGAGLRAFLQFKSYALSAPGAIRSMAQNAASGEHLAGPMGIKQIFTNPGSLSMIGKTAVSITALNVLSDLLKDVATNKTPSDISDPLIWVKAFNKSSVPLIESHLWDVVRGSYNGHPDRFATDLAGPLMGEMVSLVGITSQYGAMAFSKPRSESAEDRARIKANTAAFHFLEQHIPMRNLFYTRALLDKYLINGIYEEINPGYNDRMQKKLQTNGQEKLF